MILQELKYNESHEWARQVGGQSSLSVSAIMPNPKFRILSTSNCRKSARNSHRKTEFGVIESVKAAFDLYAPVSGEVIEVNESLLDAPEQVNESPYDDGWFLKIRITNPDELNELLDADSYQAHIEAEHA